MSSFENVTVIKEANIYFDGKVTSRVVNFADGSKKTLGIMMPGDYEFGTDDNELMEIQAGEMDVLLPVRANGRLLLKDRHLKCQKIQALNFK